MAKIGGVCVRYTCAACGRSAVGRIEGPDLERYRLWRTSAHASYPPVSRLWLHGWTTVRAERLALHNRYWWFCPVCARTPESRLLAALRGVQGVIAPRWRRRSRLWHHGWWWLRYHCWHGIGRLSRWLRT